MAEIEMIEIGASRCIKHNKDVVIKVCNTCGITINTNKCFNCIMILLIKQFK